ncbi:MAG: hypothetical protein K0R52_848 [Alphaproteobacteria bacterium]|nr:hypothetical protein [Alphaproteobacteria bacterium]
MEYGFGIIFWFYVKKQSDSFSLRTLNYNLLSLKNKGLIDRRGETNNRIWILAEH